MTLHIWKDSQQTAAFFVCIITLPLCFSATLLRFVATAKSDRKYGVENWFALVALVFFLVYTSMFLYLITVMDGRTLPELETAPAHQVIHVLKVGWAMSPQFCGNQLFTKLSLLFLYYRIFWVNKTFVRWLYGLGVIQIAWFISAYLVKWMMCWPVQYIWDKTIPGGTCTNIGAFLAASETINSLVDFAMLGLAVWTVQSLKVSRASKWRLSILFSLGGLSGVVGFVKVGDAYSAAYTNILDPIWDIVQMASSIICCCAPIYRSLLVDVHPFHALRSHVSNVHLFKSIRSTIGSSTRRSGDTKLQSISRTSGDSKEKRWLHCDESHQNRLVWAQVTAGRAPSTDRASEGRCLESENSEQRHHHNKRIPDVTLEIRQDVEFV